MRKTNENTIKDSLKMMVKELRIEDKLNELEIKEMWTQIMGSDAQQYTKKIVLSKKILFLEIDSAPLRHEILLAKEEIIKLYNARFEKEVVKKIVINSI